MRLFSLRALVLSLAVAVALIPAATAGDKVWPVHEKRFGERSVCYMLPDAGGPHPVIVALCGRTQSGMAYCTGSILGRLSGQHAFARRALELGYAVVAPNPTTPRCEGVYQWDYTETDPNRSDNLFLKRVIDWIKSGKDFPVRKDRIYVVGISSGGFMASRLAQLFADDIAKVVIRSAGNANDMSIEGRRCIPVWGGPHEVKRHPPTMLIHGVRDRLVPVRMSDQYEASLKRAGVEVVYIRAAGKGHRWFTDYDDRIFEFLR